MGQLAFRTAVKPPTISSITSTSASRLDVNWALPSGFSIALTEVEFSLDGTSGWSQVYSGAALTYAHTGRLASTAYYYRARVKDSQGNYSAYSSVSNQTTQANPTTIRYTGGHWIAPDGYNRTLSQAQSIIDAAPSIISGLQLPVRASMLEGNTQGDYSAGKQYVFDILEMCRAKTAQRGAYFGLMLYVDPDGGHPTYLRSASFDGGNGTYLTPQGVRVPCWWRSSVRDVFIARDISYVDEFDDHPNFEMHGGPRGETDTTYNVTGGPGYSDANWAASWAAWISAMSAARTRSQFRVLANFLPGGWTRMDTLIQQCLAAGAAMGGPDVYTRFVRNAGTPYPTDFGMVVNGYTKTGPGSTWLLNGTNYVSQGQLCLIHDAQTPELGGKENLPLEPNAAGLYQQALLNHDHYVVWWQLQSCWASPYNQNRQQYWDNLLAATSGELNGHYTPDIKTYLSSNSVPLNPQRPGYYP